MHLYTQYNKQSCFYLLYSYQSTFRKDNQFIMISKVVHKKSNMAAGPASYGMTDTMGRMHSDAQFAGQNSESVTTQWLVVQLLVRLTLLLHLISNQLIPNSFTETSFRGCLFFVLISCLQSLSLVLCSYQFSNVYIFFVTVLKKNTFIGSGQILSPLKI